MNGDFRYMKTLIFALRCSEGLLKIDSQFGGEGLLECYRATGEQIDNDGAQRIRIKQRNEAWINIHQTTDFVMAFATEP